jgi:hypothetical protein
MVRKFPILRLGGLAINGTPLALACSLLLWVALALVAAFAFKLPPATAVARRGWWDGSFCSGHGYDPGDGRSS